MPVYDITSPDGKEYEVTAPDGASEADILSYAQNQFKAEPAQAPSSPTPYQFPKSAGEVLQKMRPEIIGRSKAALMGAGQGLTANFADELVPNTEEYRKSLEEAKNKYPISYGAGQIGGGGVAAAGALAALPAVPAAIAASPTMLGRAGLSALASAPGGFLQGLGEGRGTLAERAPSGVANSLLSAAIGGIASPLTSGAAIKNSLTTGEIPLTLGQQTQDAAKQSFESSALKGSKGDAAQKIMTAARDVQNSALNNRLEKLKAGTGLGQVDEFGAVSSAIDSITKQREVMNKQVGNAYDLARDSGEAKINALDVKSLLQDNINAVKQDFNLSTLPKGQALVNEIDNITSKDVTKKSSLLDASGNPINNLKQLAPVDINELERWRRKVSRATQSSDPEERAFASAIIKKYDNFHNAVLDNALVKGDEATVQAYKNARDLRADFGRRFESNEIVKDVLTNDYTPETVVGKIYGASTFKSKSEAANTVNGLLKAAGDQAPEVKSQLKYAIVDRLITRSRGNEVDEVGNAIVSPAKMLTNINELLNSNKSLAESILTADDIKLLKDTKESLSKIVSTKPGAVNTSNSGEKILANVGRLAGIPIAGDIAKSFSNAKNAREAMKALGQIQQTILKPDAAQTRFVLSASRALTPSTGLNKENK